MDTDNRDYQSLLRRARASLRNTGMVDMVIAAEAASLGFSVSALTTDALRTIDTEEA